MNFDTVANCVLILLVFVASVTSACNIYAGNNGVGAAFAVFAVVILEMIFNNDRFRTIEKRIDELANKE